MAILPMSCTSPARRIALIAIGSSPGSAAIAAPTAPTGRWWPAVQGSRVSVGRANTEPSNAPIPKATGMATTDFRANYRARSRHGP